PAVVIPVACEVDGISSCRQSRTIESEVPGNGDRTTERRPCPGRDDKIAKCCGRNVCSWCNQARGIGIGNSAGNSNGPCTSHCIMPVERCCFQFGLSIQHKRTATCKFDGTGRELDERIQ